MSESLFQISCPSCEAVFAVTDPELIGQIVACPKCGGMILVEAAQDAANERVGEATQDAAEAQNRQTTRNGENEENAAKSRIGEDAQNKRDAQNAAQVPIGGETRVAEETQGEDDEAETTANEETASGKEGRRVGKLVGGGVALLLIGAAAFLATKNVREGVAPDVETGVETKAGQNGEDGTNAASDNDADDVGGFAPFALEPRTGADSETSELATLFSESAGEDAEDAGNSEATSVGEDGQDGGDKGNSEERGEVANLTTGESNNKLEDEEPSGDAQREESQNEKKNENGEGEAIKRDGELSENETSETTENENRPEINDLREGVEGLEEDEALGDLNGLDDLGDLGDLEGLGEEDALENVDQEASSENKLAGSNASTGFNEADFERANQNDDPESAEETVEVDWSEVASTTNPTLQGALPTLRRERKEIDVDARLALPIKSIEFPTSPVAALRILSEFTGVSIVPDLETFVLTRSGMNATLDLALRDVTAGEALEKVAELLKWEVCKEKERILIRPSEGASDALVEERFDVADLTSPLGKENASTNLEKFELPNNLTPETLAALIRSTVAPESWSENGGRATLRVDGSTLIIGQNAQNREKTRILLEGLRAVRALEPLTDASPERIIPEKLGWENLMKKTTFAPLTPPALQNAVEIIENSQKLQVFWDDAALNEAGVGRDATTAARVEGGSVDALLSEALEPLNANYLILGEKLIFITDAATAENYRTVEIFSLIDEKGRKPTLDEARALVAELKQAIAPASWTETNDKNSVVGENAREEKTFEGDESGAPLPKENGEIEEEGEGREEAQNAPINQVGEGGEVGETGGSALDAVVWLDVESSCLIIRQSQPNQRALRRWLNARLVNSASEVKKGERVNQEE